jgi:carbonic anhydrase
MKSVKNLVEGFRRFREQHFESHDNLYQQLVKQGQTPRILVVACCDSRVDPALVFGCDPGDLFVIRNVANLVPPLEDHHGHHGTTAAIEYGVNILGVRHIIVLGHAHCGGINALVRAGGVCAQGSYIDDWMCLAENARAEVMEEMPHAPLEEKERACEQRAILGSLDNLKTFHWIRERIEQGALTLHGWYFDMENGRLLVYDAATGRFETL